MKKATIYLTLFVLATTLAMPAPDHRYDPYYGYGYPQDDHRYDYPSRYDRPYDRYDDHRRYEYHHNDHRSPYDDHYQASRPYADHYDHDHYHDRDPYYNHGYPDRDYYDHYESYRYPDYNRNDYYGYSPYRYPEDDLRGHPNRRPDKKESNESFDPKAAMQDARKLSQSTRAVADLVDDMTSTRGASSLANLLGENSHEMSKTLSDFSSLIRGTASFMERGTQTLAKITDIME